MAKQNSVNLDITNNADGFTIAGGSTSRTLGVSGANITLVGSGTATLTFPTVSTTLAGLGITQEFTALQFFSGGISASAGIFSGGISASAGITGGSHILSESGFRVGSSSINSQSDSYSLQTTDNGKIITVNAASLKTITVPTGLPVGFNCTIIRIGSGRVTFTGSGTTINSVDGLLEIASQHGAASLLCYTNNTFNLSGNLA